MIKETSTSRWQAFLIAQKVKNPPAMQETPVWSLGWEDPLEKEMAAHFSTLAWKIPWTEEHVGYSPWGRKESDTTERLNRTENKTTVWCFFKVKPLSCVWLFVTPWTVGYQTPPSMGFSRQECWSGLPFPSPGDLPNPGIEPRSPALQTDALPSEPPGKPSFP